MFWKAVFHQWRCLIQTSISRGSSEFLRQIMEDHHELLRIQRWHAQLHLETGIGTLLKMFTYNKVKICFYIANYPVRWTTQRAIHFISGRHVHSDTNSASPGSILAMQQFAQRLYINISTTVYSQVLITTAE